MSFDVPVLSVAAIKPTAMDADIVGSSVEGPRNAYGQVSSASLAGGGLVTAICRSCFVSEPSQHRYINALAGRLNGSARNIVVPLLLTDWAGPFPVVDGKPQPFEEVPHDDGAYFDDDTGYWQSNANGEAAAAALNAGTLEFELIAGEELQGGEWFSIEHATKGHRAYRIWTIDVFPGDGVDTYTVGIVPPLREAIVADTYLEFARPMCVMRLPAGVTIPWAVSDFWLSRPDIPFIEAF